MAGHSKWSNIRYRKERADAKKGKLFSRISKEIISSVKLGGPDAKGNARLRLVLQKARDVNYPSDNIERLIKKASSPDQADFTEMSYELYGHGGVGIIVEGMTDNKNRAASEMRIATNKRGGTIATPGAVSFNFERKGLITLARRKELDEDALFLLATDAGAEDFETEEENIIVTTDPTQLAAVKEALTTQGISCDSAEIEMVPKSLVTCDPETAQANLALIEWLEGLDDVDAVYHNMEI